MTYYIQFKVPETDVKILATTEAEATIVPPSLKIGPLAFIRIVTQRASDRNVDRVRLEMPELLTKSGKPIRDPIRILSALNKLNAGGWRVRKEKFMQHYRSRFMQHAQEPKHR